MAMGPSLTDAVYRTQREAYLGRWVRLGGAPREAMPELSAALERAKAWLATLTPEQREAHFAEQKRRWVASEAAWDEDATVVVRQ